MRNTAINAILEYAKGDPNLMLLTADLGYSVMEKFAAELPGQFLNVGIAEQNMIGLAAGLALMGKKVIVYTIVPFATMRCFEQIRVDVCYQNLDVKVIGVGGGFAYGTLGTTHYAIEDLAIMRVLPNMKVLTPADAAEARQLVPLMLDLPGPCYLRLNRGGEIAIHSESEIKLQLGQGIMLSPEAEILVIASGNILQTAKEAVDALKAQDIKVQLMSLPFLKPVDHDWLVQSLKDKKIVFTVEEHSIIGGLGSIIAELIAENGLDVRLKRLGVNDEYYKVIGKQDYMRDLAGVSAEKIIDHVKQYVTA